MKNDYNSILMMGFIKRINKLFKITIFWNKGALRKLSSHRD
jgi:hypothetical protein